MNYNQNRVFVTGLGSVSTFGTGVDALWRGCLNGKPHYEKIPEHWKQVSPFNSDIYSPLPGLDYFNHSLSRIEQLQADTAVLNLLVACSEAIKNAALGVSTVCKKTNRLSIDEISDPYSAGVFMGTGNGGVNSLLENYRHFTLNKMLTETPETFPSELRRILAVPQRLNKYTTARGMPNAVAASVGIKYGIKGIVNAFCYACSSSTIAIGNAYEAIRSNRVQLAIAGGTEYATDHLGCSFRSFDVANTLASEQDGILHGPFDKRSNGFLFSEGGAGALILESESSMVSRGAEPLAEIVGFSETFDAHNIMAPIEDGFELKRLLRNLLEQSGVNADEIDYINAHGTGTKNDGIEAEAFQGVFPHRPICNSSKSIFGHTLGASGVLESMVTVLSLKNGTVHESAGVDNVIESINLVRSTQKYPIKTALKISSAFGGHNAALLFRKE